MAIELDVLTVYLLAMAVSFGLVAVALAIYVVLTPFKELRLIAAGNRAASLALGGTAIGLALVVNGVTQGQFGPSDLIRWSAVGLAFQLLVPLITALLAPRLREGIEQDKVGYGIVMACLSIAAGLINAGALTRL